MLGALSALWLGILTSVSPCPLATNIAAISFIGRRISKARTVFLTGLIYTLGRMLAYVVLGVLLVASVLSIPQVSHFLQKYMNKLLGPILILVGLVLLELVRTGLSVSAASEKIQNRAERWGIWGAGLLGIIFALSFCPLSAALFFGSLLPLSIKYGSSVTLPALYGLGTGIPVLVFAVLMAVGTQAVGKAFDSLTKIELWVRRITGAIFVVVGVYFCLVHIFRVIQ
jgi:cytochrome c biogenesis protein CcdA